MTWTVRRVAASVGLFVVLIVAGAWPWPRLPCAFSAVYCPVANLIISQQTFGHGGHARLVPLERIVRQASDNVSADTALSLTVDGVEGELAIGVSLKRDAYLPLLLLIALIAVAPLPVARRLKAAATAVPIMIALSVAAIELIVVWTFALRLKGIYDPSAATRRLIDFAFGALLTPPGNRFIAPIALGAAVIAWQARDPPAAPGARRIRRPWFTSR